MGSPVIGLRDRLKLPQFPFGLRLPNPEGELREQALLSRDALSLRVGFERPSAPSPQS
jgi:hypothetical protein